MRIVDYIQCIDFPCLDARQESYLIPNLDLEPESIRLMLISETAPTNPRDDYYAPGEASFACTTLQAFQEGGLQVAAIT